MRGLHERIIAAFKAAFPEFQLVQFYREDDDTPPSEDQLPACLLEMEEVTAAGDEADPMTGQSAADCKFVARVVMGFRTEDVKMISWVAATDVFHWLRFQHFGVNTEAAKPIGVYVDEFSPSLDPYEVRRVEWITRAFLGEEDADPSTFGIPLYSWAPKIGIGHKGDYREFDGVAIQVPE